jgi:hypothetical protein
MNAAREEDLHDEADEREIDDDLRKECGDRVPGALRLGGGHVQLLFDDRRANRREGDDQGDQLQVFRVAKHLQRFRAADALLFTGLARVGLACPLLAADHPHDDAETHGQDGRTHQQHRVLPELLHQQRRQAGAHGAAEAGAAANQAEQALRLARVVDIVGDRPELADREQAEDKAENVESDRYPFALDLGEQNPEHEQQRHESGLGDRDRPAPRHQRHQPGISLHQHADQHAGAELHPRQVVGAQTVDELRSRDRLDDVVAGHRQERIREHEEGSRRLALPYLRDGAEQAARQRTRRTFGHLRSA